MIVLFSWLAATLGAMVSSQYDVQNEWNREPLSRSLTTNGHWNGSPTRSSVSEEAWLSASPLDHYNTFSRGEAEHNVDRLPYKRSHGGAARAGLVEITHASWTSSTFMRPDTRDPALWKMQKFIAHSGESTLRKLGIQLPKAIMQPSPEALLMGWVAITLAAVVYCEYRSGHRYRRLALLASILLGMTIGMAEGSSAHSVILTNMPWCLALCMLIDCLIYNVYGAVCRRISHGRRSAWEKQFGKEEKEPRA